MPVVQGNWSSAILYAFLLFVWVASLISGFLCYWMSSLSILPPAFLLWSNLLAGHVTGLPTTTYIDVQPLTEVSNCIGLGLLINQVYLRLQRDSGGLTADPGRAGGAVRANDTFANLLLLIAISVHLANYFGAFVAKMKLDGPFGAWITENNPAYIFLVALDDDHIIFAGYPRIVSLVYHGLDYVCLYSNIWIILIQFLAVAAFLLPRSAFLLLLVMFDVMHIAIFLTVGANFWPWIILNIIIATVVAGPYFRPQSMAMRFVATGFILVAPLIAHVTYLGWYDSGANNKLYFEAVDKSGKRYPVPTNFFTYYSYSFGHMDYGMPEPGTAFATGEPNGGVDSNYKLFLAGRSCDVGVLTQNRAHNWFDREKLPDFIRNYHRLALWIDSKIGTFPYDFYPHHFYVPFSRSTDFDGLDKRLIVAYIYRRDSVCVSFDEGALRRKLVSSAEYRIPINGVK